MFGALGGQEIAASAPEQAEPAPLLFAASTAPVPSVPQWELGSHDAAPVADERAPTFNSFDPVSFEHEGAAQHVAPQWSLSDVEAAQADDGDALVLEDSVEDFGVAALDDAAGASLELAAVPVFDPVAAEHDGPAVLADEVVFHFDNSALDNADDVLSLQAMETLSLDEEDDTQLPVLEIVDAVEAAPVEVLELESTATIAPVEQIDMADVVAEAAPVEAPGPSRRACHDRVPGRRRYHRADRFQRGRCAVLRRTERGCGRVQSAGRAGHPGTGSRCRGCRSHRLRGGLR